MAIGCTSCSTHSVTAAAISQVMLVDADLGAADLREAHGIDPAAALLDRVVGDRRRVDVRRAEDGRDRARGRSATRAGSRRTTSGAGERNRAQGRQASAGPGRTRRRRNARRSARSASRVDARERSAHGAVASRPDKRPSRLGAPYRWVGASKDGRLTAPSAWSSERRARRRTRSRRRYRPFPSRRSAWVPVRRGRRSRSRCGLSRDA